MEIGSSGGGGASRLPNEDPKLLAVGGEFGGRDIARTDDSVIDNVGSKPTSVD